jgi:hypothetical protein
MVIPAAPTTKQEDRSGCLDKIKSGGEMEVRGWGWVEGAYAQRAAQGSVGLRVSISEEEAGCISFSLFLI